MKTIHFKLILSIIIFIGLQNQSNAQSILRALDSSELQAMVNKLIDTTDIPGVHLALVSMNGLEHHVFAGKKVVNQNQKMEKDDLMHLGSNTKSMTGFIAAALVERNLISWDTLFFDIFPELKQNANSAYHKINLQDLLQHRAFIQPYTEDEEFERLPTVTEEPILKQRITWFKELLALDPVEIDPSLGFTYSNAGYTMAAAMLEKVSGQEYEFLMETYLFEPLEIDGCFGWPENYGDNQPKGHYIHDNEDTISILRKDEGYHIGRMVAPAGDVCLTTEDYARYLQAQLLGLNGYNIVLANASYRKIHEVTDGMKYALGWGIGDIELDSGTYTFATHDGSGGTYLCKTILIPGIDVGLTIMINSAEDHHDLAIKRLRNQVLRSVFTKL